MLAKICTLKLWMVVFSCVASLMLSACASAGRPITVIASPPSGSQYVEGDDVSVQSTSTDSLGVARVELVIDGTPVRVDPSPNPQLSFTVIQTWKATVGVHTVTVRAYNANGVASDPAAISISVAPKVAQGATSTPALPTPIPPTGTPPSPSTPTSIPPTAPPNCVNNASFVADVSIPDGTPLAAGQPFNKVWRLKNNGTCPWGAGYTFVFIAGEAMGAATVVNVANTSPNATTDILVPMVAPIVMGGHAGQWRMRAPTGALFGQVYTVQINVVGATPLPATSTPAPVTLTPTNCPIPTIDSFIASPASITAGSSSILSWGSVNNATSASIDQGIGGVPAPGSISVSPTTTTMYTLTANGCGGTTTKQITVTVSAAPTPTPTTITRCSLPSESGEAIKSGNSRAITQALYVGDDNSNNAYRTFLSFDIHDLAGKTIDVGNLNIGGTVTQGSPFALGTLFVGVLDYGTLDGSDYDLSGTSIVNITSGPNGQYNIKSTIQSAVTANKTRLQLRLHFASETNNNNVADNFNWPSNNNLCLTLTYH